MGLVRLTNRGEKILLMKKQVLGMKKGELIEFALINMPMVRFQDDNRKKR